MTTTEDIMEGLNKVIIKYTFILIPPFTTEILTHVEFISNLKKKKKKKSETTKTRLSSHSNYVKKRICQKLKTKNFKYEFQ